MPRGCWPAIVDLYSPTVPSFNAKVRFKDVIGRERDGKRSVMEHLERAGFVVMKRAPVVGGAALGRGHEG